jgi:hypothetical protein
MSDNRSVRFCWLLKISTHYNSQTTVPECQLYAGLYIHKLLSRVVPCARREGYGNAHDFRTAGKTGRRILHHASSISLSYPCIWLKKCHSVQFQYFVEKLLLTFFSVQSVTREVSKFWAGILCWLPSFFLLFEIRTPLWRTCDVAVTYPVRTADENSYRVWAHRVFVQEVGIHVRLHSALSVVHFPLVRWLLVGGFRVMWDNTLFTDVEKEYLHNLYPCMFLLRLFTEPAPDVARKPQTTGCVLEDYSVT